MTEQRLIDANALKRLRYTHIVQFWDGKLIKSLPLSEAPTVDAVEVVRRKDCKHFCPYEGEEHKGDCAELVGLESCVYEDDFCSYGERRTDG